MKTVYTCFSTDDIHEGHMNIVREAQKYGRVEDGDSFETQRLNCVSKSRNREE